MIRSKKIDVVALGSRDYYHVALGLKSEGLLGALITDFYTPNCLRKILRKRFSQDLQANQTRSLIALLLPIKLLSRIFIWSRPKQNIFNDYLFGYVSCLLTWSQGRNAIVYSYYAVGFADCLRHFGIRSVKFIIFQVHPTPWFVSEILNQDADKWRRKGLAFKPEQDVFWGERAKAQLRRSLAKSEAVICASDVTKASLEHSDADLHETKLHVVPYGSRFEVIERPSQTDGVFKLLSVGSVSQRKGLHVAFEALKSINHPFTWDIVGDVQDRGIEEMAPPSVTFHGRVSEERLQNFYANANLFVLPSLVEGFGLVYLEAMANMCPVLCSDRTGITKHLENRVSGLVCEAGNIDEVRDAILWAITNRETLQTFPELALKACNKMTWKNFEGHIGRLGKALSTA